GKKCPLWYVEHPEAWLTFRERVRALVNPPQPDKLYRVQVGAYRDRKNAEKQVQELKSKGYNPIVKEE
ncbi:SPOR domain-containing protein, partial [Ligaoa zhengdingensis]